MVAGDAILNHFLTVQIQLKKPSSSGDFVESIQQTENGTQILIIADEMLVCHASFLHVGDLTQYLAVNSYYDDRQL